MSLGVTQHGVPPASPRDVQTTTLDALGQTRGRRPRAPRLGRDSPPGGCTSDVLSGGRAIQALTKGQSGGLASPVARTCLGQHTTPTPRHGPRTVVNLGGCEAMTRRQAVGANRRAPRRAGPVADVVRGFVTTNSSVMLVMDHTTHTVDRAPDPRRNAWPRSRPDPREGAAGGTRSMPVRRTLPHRDRSCRAWCASTTTGPTTRLERRQ